MLNRIKTLFNRKGKTDEVKGSKLFPLTPVLLDDKELERYAEDFDAVFSNPKLLNIALSGPYGSGKSTVIESWERKHSNEEWLYVSLACFDERDNKDPKTAQALESALLNQMIYRIDLTKAPRTRFSQTKSRCWVADAGIALSVVVFFILSIWLWNNASSFSVDNLCFRIDLIIAGAVWFLIATIGCYRAIRRRIVGKFVKKLKFVNAELELSDPNDPSIFNRCMDDIVYLINESKFEVVVFEDIDRFETVVPFEKLRELNILANQSRNKKPLRFFYLVRDSLFENASDRTKFFDFIIPVIPYADSTNSYDILKAGFDKFDLKPEPEFLYQISLFINNSRLIHDIINETNHYKTALFGKTEDMNQKDMNRLLAMVSYKVIFPNDYEKLQIGQGCVHCLFEKKQESIRQSILQNRDSIKRLKEDLRAIETQNNFNEDELLLLYAAQAFGLGLHQIGLNDEHYEEPISTSLNKFESLDNSSEWQTALSRLKQNEEYQDRLAKTREESTLRSEDIRQQIASLESNNISYARMTISDYLNTISDAESYFRLSQEEREKGFLTVDAEKQVLDSPYYPLIRFTILHGWIDESYSRYMSNFYTESLSSKDRDAIVSILQGLSIDAEYEFDNAEEALRRLDEDSLKRSCSKNYSIFRHLLQKDSKPKLSSFFSGLQQDKDGAFLLNYVCSNMFVDQAFTAMEKYLDEPVQKILKDDSYPVESRRCFCHRFITARNPPKDEYLLKAARAFAVKDDLFLKPDGVEASELKRALDLIKYQAMNLDIDRCKESLLTYIYTKGMFAPDAKLLGEIRSAVVRDNDSPETSTLIERVHAGKETGAIASIEANPDLFVFTYLETNKNIICDSEDEVTWILGIDCLSKEQGLAYISALKDCCLTVLKTICRDEFQQALLDNNAVTCSTENILGYFSSSDGVLDEHLASFLEANQIPEDMTHNALKSFDPPATDFSKKMIASPHLSDSKLEEFLSKCYASYPQFSMENLKDSRVTVLIKLKVIQLTQNNLEFVRGHYPNCVVEFAKVNIEEYVSLVMKASDDDGTLFLFSDEEAMQLFAEESVPTECKIDLVSHFDYLRLSETYSNEVNIKIIKEHFSKEDIELLPKFYALEDEQLKKAVVGRIVIEWSEITQWDIQLPRAAVQSALSIMDITRNEKLIFIAHQLNAQNPGRISRNNLKNWFDAANLPEYAKLVKGPSANIRNTTEDNNLLRAMDKHNMIGKHEPDFGSPNKNGERRVSARGYQRSHSQTL